MRSDQEYRSISRDAFFLPAVIHYVYTTYNEMGKLDGEFGAQVFLSQSTVIRRSQSGSRIYGYT